MLKMKIQVPMIMEIMLPISVASESPSNIENNMVGNNNINSPNGSWI